MRISDWSSDVCSSDLPSSTNVSKRAAASPLNRQARAPSITVFDAESGRWFSSSFPMTKARVSAATGRDGLKEIFMCGPLYWESVTSENTHRKHLMQRQRSEEHTSELQSLMRISYAVFCLKKKKQKK